jgi:hypothetical protein
MAAISRDFQQSDTRYAVFFLPQEHPFVRYTMVKKGSWGSDMLAVASRRVYIRGGREMCCESYDDQQPAVLASSHWGASPSHGSEYRGLMNTVI